MSRFFFSYFTWFPLKRVLYQGHVFGTKLSLSYISTMCLPQASLLRENEMAALF